MFTRTKQNINRSDCGFFSWPINRNETL